MASCTNCGTSLDKGSRFCAQCGHATDAAAPGGPTAAAPGVPHNVAAALCYLFWFITAVVFLVLEPYDRDPFVRFHAFQSIFFTLAAIIASTLVGALGFVGAVLWYPVWLALMVVWVLLMVQALSGKKWKLPLIGGWAESQSRK